MFHRHRGLIPLRLLLALAFLPVLMPVHSAAPESSIYYSSDAWTLLFDDFEGTSQAQSRAASASFSTGYLGGQALMLSDTKAYALYSDTWWLNAENLRTQGTVEMYYRPDTFLFTPAQGYAVLFSTDERANTPPGGGYPALAVKENGNLSWSISKSPAQYAEIDYPLQDDSPPLYPTQWYHLAATWESGGMRLYINGVAIGTETFDTSVLTEPFQLGSRNTDPLKALAARGRIDRFRLSSVARSPVAFPSALDVRIDSPLSRAGGVDLARPFVVVARAYASDSRTRIVSLYADTDATGFDGTLLAAGLPESGSFLLNGALGDSTVYLYAIARAGTDSAFFYHPFPFQLTASEAFGAIQDPLETSAVAVVPVTGSESYSLVLLNGGTTSDSPSGSANATGTGAGHALQFRLLDPSDTAVMHIWSRGPTGGVMLSVRSDTSSLRVMGLPGGIPSTATGIQAFSRTAFLAEFLEGSGRMIGDTRSTSSIHETYAFTIEYRLSSATAALFRSLGFDTSPGSGSFGLYYADTWGAVWIEDRTVMVTVSAGDAGGIVVRCAGITKDLPGGLGMASVAGPAIVSVTEKPGCLLQGMGFRGEILQGLRITRDYLLSTRLGRLFVRLYYLL